MRLIIIRLQLQGNILVSIGSKLITGIGSLQRAIWYLAASSLPVLGVCKEQFGTRQNKRHTAAAIKSASAPA
jgi:hypothetical protein